MKKWAADLIREQFKIPGCRSLIRLDKEVRREGKLLSYETRYFISSLDPDVVSASECQGFVLHHWDVENGLHLQKDKYYGEDKHVFRRTVLAEVWTVLTNIGLSLARLYRKGERTLREVREQFLANPQNAFK
ncbi:hypothetical protein FACS1894189_8480 [Planctomycetales bacterium]|nr:hypothetical protein FACS1894189_8480 [Planctomycetales bacterium]